MILAIDPGTTESGYCVYENGKLFGFGKTTNEAILNMVADYAEDGATQLVIEEIKSYGGPVGATTFETVRWCGRFEQQWVILCDRAIRYVPRLDVRMYHCKTTWGIKDSNVKQAVIDRYGGKDIAVGKKKTPGPLYGVKADAWQALALAICAEGTSTKRG